MTTIHDLRLSFSVCVICIVPAHSSLAETPKPIMTIEQGAGYIVFSPDGKRLAGKVPGTGWRPTDVKMWEVASGKEVLVLKGHTGGCCT